LDTIEPYFFNTSGVEPGEGFIAFSRTLGVMSYNEAAGILLQRNPKPGEALLLGRLFAPQDLPMVKTIVDDALNHGRSCSMRPGRMITSKGLAVFCEYSVMPLFRDPSGVIGFILSFKPISRIAEDSSIKTGSETFSGESWLDYSTLFEGLPEGVFTVNNDWRITSFNRTAEKLTGFRKVEVLNRLCWEVFRANICKNGCVLRHAMETGKSCMDQDVCILNRQGLTQSLLVNAGALRNRSGDVIGAVETFRPSPARIHFVSGTFEDHSFEGIIGKSPVMQNLFSRLPDIAESEASVLICGESGTGKDLLAQAVHRKSRHSKGPFVAVNCMAFAESLLESELFGHEKGAFTGAERTKPGRFELAKGGTLFLDEIGELKPEFQVKLLRVLEQREFERVGGTRSIQLEARIISATNQNLTKAMKEGRFREDLYYRLRTVPINMPPLSERSEDIPLLVEYFIRKLNQKYEKKVRSVDPKVMRFFMEYQWPGNIRELERTLEHAFVFVKGPVIFQHYLPGIKEFSAEEPTVAENIPTVTSSQSKNSILWALSRSGGRRKEAAALLQISRTSLWRRMRELGLE
jgi:PAS domain S-box-containing protein